MFVDWESLSLVWISRAFYYYPPRDKNYEKWSRHFDILTTIKHWNPSILESSREKKMNLEFNSESRVKWFPLESMVATLGGPKFFPLEITSTHKWKSAGFIRQQSVPTGWEGSISMKSGATNDSSNFDHVTEHNFFSPIQKPSFVSNVNFMFLYFHLRLFVSVFHSYFFISFFSFLFFISVFHFCFFSFLVLSVLLCFQFCVFWLFSLWLVFRLLVIFVCLDFSFLLFWNLLYFRLLFVDGRFDNCYS